MGVMVRRMGRERGRGWASKWGRLRGSGRKGEREIEKEKEL